LRQEAKELLKFGNREAGQLGKLRDFFFKSHLPSRARAFAVTCSSVWGWG
jgi:hypothetical protein